MPGAEKIGEAFVEFGGKKDALRKDLNDAKRMTNSAFSEMGKMSDRLGSSLLQVGKVAAGAVGAGSIGAAITTGLSAGADLQDAVQDMISELARGFGADQALPELQKVHDQIEAIKTATKGAFSTREIQRVVRIFQEAGVPLDNLTELVKALVGHSGQLNIALEETARRYAAVAQKGADAVDLFKAPISPGIPALAQAAAVRDIGLERFPAEIAKLDSLTGLLKQTSAIISNVAGRFGLGIGVLLGKSPSMDELQNIADAAAQARRAETAKTSEEIARRRLLKPGQGGILTDEELRQRGQRFMNKTFGPPDGAPSSFFGFRPLAPPAPAGIGADSSISVLEQILEELKLGNETKDRRSALDAIDAIRLGG